MSPPGFRFTSPATHATTCCGPSCTRFYADEVRSIRERYGDFVLVNTNFNHVNAFFPAQNLFKPVKTPASRPSSARPASA